MNWIPINKSPTSDGRYLVLTTFPEPCISNDNIVREKIPFVRNFTCQRGWNSTHGEQITHWMEIPSLSVKETTLGSLSDLQRVEGIIDHVLFELGAVIALLERAENIIAESED